MPKLRDLYNAVGECKYSMDEELDLEALADLRVRCVSADEEDPGVSFDVVEATPDFVAEAADVAPDGKGEGGGGTTGVGAAAV